MATTGHVHPIPPKKHEIFREDAKKGYNEGQKAVTWMP